MGSGREGGPAVRHSQVGRWEERHCLGVGRPGLGPRAAESGPRGSVLSLPSPRLERWPLPPRLWGPAPPSLRAWSLPLPPAWRNLQPGLRVPREMLSHHVWLLWRLWAEEGTPLPPVVFSHPEAEGLPPRLRHPICCSQLQERQRRGGGRWWGAASKGGHSRRIQGAGWGTGPSPWRVGGLAAETHENRESPGPEPVESPGHESPFSPRSQMLL